MFHFTSKVFWLVAQPSSLCEIAMLLGLLILALTRMRRLGFALAFGGLFVMLAGGFLPIGNYLVLPLEQRFASQALPAASQPVAGIMSSPLRTVSEKALVFEAMMTMMEKDFQHIGVVDGHNNVVRMLSNKDIITYQGQSPLFVLREIQTATHLDAISARHPIH